jgi:solute carrier family 25 carnitine/acylcarnitine transporter 20/29
LADYSPEIPTNRRFREKVTSINKEDQQLMSNEKQTTHKEHPNTHIKARVLETKHSYKSELNKFIAGSIGGATGILTIHPLDTIKIRMQTFPGHQPSFYGVLRETVQRESARGLYKGLLSPVVGEMAIACSIPNHVSYILVMFGVYGIIKERMDDQHMGHIALSGAMTGMAISALVSPVELIKIRLQMNTDAVRSNKYVGLRGTISEVVKSHGVKGLFLGFWSTVIREVPLTATYFLSYEIAKRYFHVENPTFMSDVWSATISGGIAGTTAWVCAYPTDVLKSTIQANKHENLTITQGIKHIYRTRGLKGFYRGLTPTLVRAFPESAATFVAYEMILKLLNTVNV